MSFTDATPDFGTYQSLVSEAVAVEVLRVTRSLILPLVLIVVDVIYSDKIQKSEDWFEIYQLTYYCILILLLARFVWRIVHRVLFVRSYRYKFDAAGMHVRSGVWNHNHITVPRNRIQHVNVSRGLMQRRYDLATLSCTTAGTAFAGLSVLHIPLELANDIRKQIIDEANAPS